MYGLVYNALPSPALPGSGSEGMISAHILRHPYWWNKGKIKVGRRKIKVESTPKSNFLDTKTQKHKGAPRLISSFSLLCEPSCLGVFVAFYYFSYFRTGLKV